MSTRAMLLSGVLTLGVALAQDSGPLGQAPSDPDDAVSVAAEIEILPILRGEYFLLEQPDADGVRRSAGRMILSRHEEDGESALELEMYFTEGDLFVRAVETQSALGQRLVWREFGDHALRTVVAMLPAGTSEVEILTWGMGEPIRRHIATKGTVRFPLGYIEALRLGEPGTDLARVWPLSSLIEVVSAMPIDLQSPEIPPTWCASIAAARSQPRAYQVVRGDGSKAESFLFDGEELVALFLQPGGLSARRVEREQYEAISGRLASTARAAGGWEEHHERSDTRTTAK